MGFKADKNEPPFRKLLVWVEWQQQQYNRLTQNQMKLFTPHRVPLLESIGMSWSRKVVTDEKWLKRCYFKLVNLQHQYDTTDVSEHYTKHRRVVKWVKDSK